MKKKNKILVIILVLLILLGISIVLLVLTNNKQENISSSNKNLLINKTIIEDIQVDNIIFSNIKYTFDNTNTTITFDITNKSESDVTLNHFIINIYDELDNLINSFHPVYKNSLRPKETLREFKVYVPIDLSKGSKIIIELLEIEKEEKE